jgi:predicted choloylglycine hydrolase
MKRRNFLAFAALTPLALQACKEKASVINFFDDSPRQFELLEVRGSYEEIGLAIGKRFKQNIYAMISERGNWLPDLLEFVDSETGGNLAEKLLLAAKKKYPYLVREVYGMSRGCGLSFKKMWTLSIKSELSAAKSEHASCSDENPGCSTVRYHDEKRSYLFHNEDGDKAFIDRMFVLKAHPTSGVSFITLAYPGLIAGVGPAINSRGVIQATNFIGPTKAFEGIPRYFLGRAILEAKDLNEAARIATSGPRAFPWHHNLAYTKTGEYVSVETLPEGRTTVYRPSYLYIHTNHLVGNATREWKFEDRYYKNLSSLPRYNSIIEDSEATSKRDPETILSWLSSKRNAPYSPCRIPEGNVTGATLATAFFDVNKGRLRLYKGAPCESVAVNKYWDYGF